LVAFEFQKEMSQSQVIKPKQRKPPWLKVKLPIGRNYTHVRGLVDGHGLHTICESGNCPNMGECWGAGTATFMILGNICTRSCGFCAVATGRPLPVDWDEPERVALAIKKMGVKHCVLTSVDRDELKDGGSGIWAMTVNKIREISPGTTLETLIPDFKGNKENLYRVLETRPEVVSHNLETVERLSRLIRPQAKYGRSLEVLAEIKNNGIRTKSGIMLGLGEEEQEIYNAIDDLYNAGVDILTMGQYLQPTKLHAEVMDYVHPDTFKALGDYALKKGFMFIESAPLVRSSYHAEKHVL
jgi:lipoyl synthase